MRFVNNEQTQVRVIQEPPVRTAGTHPAAVLCSAFLGLWNGRRPQQPQETTHVGRGSRRQRQNPTCITRAGPVFPAHVGRWAVMVVGLSRLTSERLADSAVPLTTVRRPRPRLRRASAPLAVGWGGHTPGRTCSLAGAPYLGRRKGHPPGRPTEASGRPCW